MKRTQIKRRMNPNRKAKRLCSLPEKCETTCSEVKEYKAHESIKQLVNDAFVGNVVKTLGCEIKVIVLDTKEGVTCKTLMKRGVDPRNIYAPNVDPGQCEGLRRLGVRSPEGTIERCVAHNIYRAAWYDSMTTIGGNQTRGYYVGLFAHEFMRHARSEECVLAISVATRTNQVDCTYAPQETILLQQIRSLAAWHGFSIEFEFTAQYKVGMLFGMWNLKPSGARNKNQRFHTWRGTKRLIGFPPGFTIKDL